MYRIKAAVIDCQFLQVASDMISKTLQVDSNLESRNIPVPAEFTDEVIYHYLNSEEFLNQISI